MRESLAALGRVLAELRKPAVVGLGAREHEVGRHLGVEHEAGAERRAHAASGGVGPGEDHLGGDAVVVELLVTLGGVPAAAQPALVEALLAFVVAEPLLLEVFVAAHRDRARELVLGDEALTLLQRLVEGLPVLRVEELAIVRGLRAGVAVGRDDQVRVRHHRLPKSLQECRTRGSISAVLRLVH